VLAAAGLLRDQAKIMRSCKGDYVNPSTLQRRPPAFLTVYYGQDSGHLASRPLHCRDRALR
jgi:hypothetical protein